jgi:hypothetical protein
MVSGFVQNAGENKSVSKAKRTFMEVPSESQPNEEKRFRLDRCDDRLSLGTQVSGKVIRMDRNWISISKSGMPFAHLSAKTRFRTGLIGSFESHLLF